MCFFFLPTVLSQRFSSTTVQYFSLSDFGVYSSVLKDAHKQTGLEPLSSDQN